MILGETLEFVGLDMEGLRVNKVAQDFAKDRNSRKHIFQWEGNTEQSNVLEGWGMCHKR